MIRILIFLTFFSTLCAASEDGTVTCTYITGGVLCDGQKFHEGEQLIRSGSPQFFGYLLASFFCVIFAGLMSGLTIGLFSLDLLTLEVLKNGGDAKQRKYAKRITPVVNKRHLVLVTLLLSNAAAMEALPIFLDALMSPIAAIMISVTAVLFFGEIIPQALCARFGLAIGANLAWLVQGLMFLLFPISWPISKILDKILGAEHSSHFNTTELKELVTLHGQDKAGPLGLDEMTIIKGALDMRQKTVKDAMKPLDSVFMLEIKMKMDHPILAKVKEEGHSRVPVYEGSRHNIKGVLLVKSLLFVNLEDAPLLSELELREIPNIAANSSLYDLLNLFQTGKSHMASVYDSQTNLIIGIVTLEDIIEELIQEEIYDEDDLAEIYQEKSQQILKEARIFRRGISFVPQKRKSNNLSMDKKNSPQTQALLQSPPLEEEDIINSLDNYLQPSNFHS